MENPERSEKVYSALRKLYFENTLEKDSEQIKEDIFQELKSFSEEDEELDFSVERLVAIWEDLWSEELGMEMSLDDERKDFTENFIQAYLSKVSKSTIHDMLVKDFFHGMNGLYMNENVDDWLEMWFLTLKQNYESVQRPRQIAENALNRMELRKD